jgi:hypothetical protein
MYAAGEILLIFVGITLAIAFENANEAQRTHELELQILDSIAQNLEANLEELDRNVAEDTEAMRLLDSVLERMAGFQPWDESLDEALGRAMVWSSPYLASSGYENLKQLGLHLVPDDLRDQLVHLFENTYARLLGDIDRSQWAFYEAVVLPIRSRELLRIDPTGGGSRALQVRDYEAAMGRGELVAMLRENRYLLVVGLRERGTAREETVDMLRALREYLSDN